MNKQEIIYKIKTIEGLSQDDRSYLIDLINTKKRYGLVWENKTEEVEELLLQNLPVLKEVCDKARNSNYLAIYVTRIQKNHPITF